MKYTFLLIALALFTFSCSEEDVKAALEQDAPIVIDKTYDVDLSEDDPKTITKEESFSTSISGLTVTDVKIEELTISVENYSSSIGSVKLNELSFTLEGTNTSWSITDVDISTANDAFTVNVLEDLASAIISTYEEHLLSNPEAKFILSGTVSDVPVSFDLKLYMKLTVTGRPS
ncbi:hypothetical protein [Fulvivirga sp.]|uniref:hypothetical protein n=1 Tax=Fulvivirga sp. TaxID=1931237 RepID=UPI0032EEA57A